jgi:hypothetical protein
MNKQHKEGREKKTIYSTKEENGGYMNGASYR